MNLLKKSVLLAMGAVLTLASCKKDDTTTSTPTGPKTRYASNISSGKWKQVSGALDRPLVTPNGELTDYFTQIQWPAVTDQDDEWSFARGTGKYTIDEGATAAGGTAPYTTWRTGDYFWGVNPTSVTDTNRLVLIYNTQSGLRRDTMQIQDITASRMTLRNTVRLRPTQNDPFENYTVTSVFERP